MVPLGTVSDLAAQEVPVKLEPSLPGTWRWLGTNTLTFEYDSKLIDRLPKATVYRVTVPAGTKSATGGVLEKGSRVDFQHPAAQGDLHLPIDGPQPREPLFFIAFDQRIDPAAVLETIQVTAAGQQAGLKLASQDEIKADEKQKWLLDNAVEGRWLAFKATAPLPADTEVTVAIGPGTPSAEGPLTTKDPQTYSFRTYAPLRIVEQNCRVSDSYQCQPLSPFYIRFNNPIDAKTYTPSMLHIEPDLPGVSVNIYGNSISIQGASQGQTTYNVWVDGSLQDTFGQKLGQEALVSFKVGKAQPLLYGPNQTFVTLDPASKKPVFSVYTINYPRLAVRIYAVQPADWPAYNTYLREWQRTDIKVAVPGRLISTRPSRWNHRQTP